ncbi:MAG: HlyD family efflux transporter periplasmic adaptor subunit [Pirellulales bacterium]|nr:HlyD family efflux transporter periplasmic adaptor subunit [Pirellulales bacterium]
MKPVSTTICSASYAKRRGISTLGLILGMVVMLGAAGGYYWWAYIRPAESRSSAVPQFTTIDKKKFEHTVTEPGEVESSQNTEIRCEVQSLNSNGIMILEIVPNGTTVKEGDFLVRFDSSALEKTKGAQQIVVNNAMAALAQSQAAHETAKITKREYLEGTYQQEEEALQSVVFVAEENLRRAEEYARYSEKLAARGYVTGVQVEADRFAVEKARKELAAAQTKLKVLQEFTKAKMLQTLEANIEAAAAKLAADQNTLAQGQRELELVNSQIQKCKIHSPVAGKVVYANVPGGRGGQEVIIQEGTLIRERQPVIRIPDMERMQVMAKINESRIGFVAMDQPADVTIGAYGLKLSGKVVRVDEYPIPTSFFGPQIKQYATYVQIDNPPQGIRPGLTANVTINVNSIPDALVAPLEAIIEHAGEYYCLTQEGKSIVPRWVSIGASNDQEVYIKEGIAAGTQVILNPDPFLTQIAGFPPPPAGKSLVEKAQLAQAARERDNRNRQPVKSADNLPNGGPARGT